jgi:CubicO group peptidase (beta-lactamase class C family)
LISEVEFLNFKPGSRWEYSNSNYLLLAMVIEKISGQRLPEFLQQKIFGSLQLHMVVGSTSSLPGKARSYRVSTGGSGYQIADWHVYAVGAGGIQSTPSTLVRWADNYRSGGWAAPGCSRPN